MKTNQQQLLHKLNDLVESATPDNLGDIFARAIETRGQIKGAYQYQAEFSLTELRSFASQAEIGWKLFSEPIVPNRVLSDRGILQIVGVERAVHELCYCFERIEQVATLTWGGSSPSRFYLNSIYHYVSSMFLIDTSKKTHKDLPMGGTVIRALSPMGLSDLLSPIKKVLQQPLGDVSFGDAVLKLRHSHLVHGDFSPERFEYLVAESEMRIPEQQEKLSAIAWDLFYELILLNLKLIAVLTASNANIEEVIVRYINEIDRA
jgi:hypothetical protein